MGIAGRPEAKGPSPDARRATKAARRVSPVIVVAVDLGGPRSINRMTARSIEEGSR